jgi:hypothetical protein
MASLIGPAFYAGFMDVAQLRPIARDLGFYETTFLTMQKKIFEDQATMHEAFLAGGVAAIAELHAARIVDSATLEAWQQIDAGLVEPGNRTLLLREQRDIIDRFYVDMLQRHAAEGPVFTYLLTLAGAPSVPVRLADHFVVQLPGAGLEATAARIAEYAAEWEIPAEEIARWRRGAERRPASDRDYSTHVFPAGDAALEFEISHHVREGTFTLAAHVPGTSPTRSVS